MQQPQNDAALQAEYLHLQKTIEEFDGKAITIKAWSVTFSLAVLVGAFVSKAATVFLVAAVSSLLFWCLETLWKAFQLGYYARVEALEAHFRTRSSVAFPANQIATAWMAEWRQTSWSYVLLMGLTWPHILLPHAVVVIVGIALYAAAWYWPNMFVVLGPATG
jgi:hypothetical protein